MPREVRFDAVMCCALAQAFIRHPRLIADWSGSVGRLKLYADILLRTVNLTFTPSLEIGEVHRAFAVAERERLATCGAHHDLHCEHEAAQHRGALDTIIRQLPTVH